jgi:hypothetical protein
MKLSRRDARAKSPADMFGGMAPIRLAEQKSRPDAQKAPTMVCAVHLLTFIANGEYKKTIGWMGGFDAALYGARAAEPRDADADAEVLFVYLFIRVAARSSGPSRW